MRPWASGQSTARRKASSIDKMPPGSGPTAARSRSGTSGVFANHSEVKATNRRAEHELLSAEKVAVLARFVARRPFPRERLAAAWRDVLFNQFHDIIGGACVKPAYAHVRAVHGRALASAGEVLHHSLQAISALMDTSGDGYPLVVWNLNAFEVREPVEAELQWAWEFSWYRGPITVMDEIGEVVPCQVIREHSVLPGFRSRVVFRPRLPSLGYRVFRVLQRAQPEPAASGRADDLAMENESLRVEIDPATGDLAAVTCRADGRTLLCDGARAFVRRDDGDTWAFNVSGYGAEIGGFRLVSSRLAESGPVRSVVRTTARFGDSLLERDYLLYAGAEDVECRFRVSWRERHAVLKMGFDTAIETAAATVAIPYGSIARPADGREMPCGEWLDVTGDGRGVSFASDSVFAYDISGSRVNLTILRSPIYGHLSWKEPVDPEADWEFMEQGVREGRLRIVFHHGDWISRGVAREAWALNIPPVAIDEAAHPGKLPRSASYLGVQGGSCMLTVLKEREDGRDLVLRLVELGGKGGEARLEAPFLGLSSTVTMDPHEIKTLRLSSRGRRRLRETSVLEE